jgi:hypothetical protein
MIPMLAGFGELKTDFLARVDGYRFLYRGKKDVPETLWSSIMLYNYNGSAPTGPIMYYSQDWTPPSQ